LQDEKANKIKGSAAMQKSFSGTGFKCNLTVAFVGMPNASINV